MSRLSQFLGDNPLRVAVKLGVLSFIVGAVLVSIGLTPFELIKELFGFVEGIFDMGFEALRRFGEYVLVGAVIVVPIFLLSRLMRRNR